MWRIEEVYLKNLDKRTQETKFLQNCSESKKVVVSQFTNYMEKKFPQFYKPVK